MLGESNFLDSIMETILNGILWIFKMIFPIIFSSTFGTLVFWGVAINIIAIILIKKDKSYAREEKKRIRESTLLMVAFAGGAIGMYYAMFKYRHKTLHKKFTIGVPMFILMHFAFISYFVLRGII